MLAGTVFDGTSQISTVLNVCACPRLCSLVTSDARMLTVIANAFSIRSTTPATAGKSGHYLGLDLMRGIAALAVVLYHCGERFDLAYLCPHGYLAVDFFFILSGFVIAHAYYDRLRSDDLGLLRFAQLRVIRLMPMIVVGMALGAAIEVVKSGSGPFPGNVMDVGTAFILGTSLVPVLSPMLGGNLIFPLNAPIWSLFFEAVANAVFAICTKLRLGTGALGSFLIAGGILLAYCIVATGKVDGGARTDDFLAGFPRIAWSFSIGIVLFHLRDRAPRASFQWPLLLLVTTLVMPLPPEGHDIFDVVGAFALLPMIVWMASAAKFGPLGQSLSALSGDLSYPVYAIHIIVMRVVSLIATPFHFGLAGRLSCTVAVVIAAITTSALLYTCYDVPARRWLTYRLKRSARASVS